MLSLTTKLAIMRGLGMSPTSRFSQFRDNPKMWKRSICIYRCPACEFHSEFGIKFVLLIDQNEDGGNKKATRGRELDAAEKRITELSAIFKRLYEDSVAGRITEERFAELSADYKAEQKQLKDRVAELEKELSKAQETTVNADRGLKVVQKYSGFEELTHTLLREFVEKIVVHECYRNENGSQNRTSKSITSSLAR